MIPDEAACAFLAELRARLAASTDPGGEAMRLIASRFSHYKWVGIYRLQGDQLVLGPYVGPPPEHTQIAVGQGVCGTAIALERNQIVGDVRRLTNYLACSATTRSEIVVLIRRGGQIIGQIDADADETGAFDESDEFLLTRVAELLPAD